MVGRVGLEPTTTKGVCPGFDLPMGCYGSKVTRKNYRLGEEQPVSLAPRRMA